MEWIWLGFLLSGIVGVLTALVLSFIASEFDSQAAGWWARMVAIASALAFLISIWTGVLNLSMG